MYKYKVLENRLLTPTVRLLTLACENEDDRPLLYQPGQYASISLHDKLRPTMTRCFSISSSPTNQGILQFSIRVGGNFTNSLKRLKEGYPVSVRGPFGHFVFNENTQPELVMFAGGIGIAPFVSMIKYANHLNLNNKMKLVYSCKTQDDIPFYEDLQNIEKNNPNIEITYVIGKGPTDKINSDRVVSGRMNKESVSDIGLNTEQTFMICGPIPYMEAMSKILEENGVPKDKILTEAFSQSSKFKSGGLAGWSFNSYFLTGLSLAALFLFIGVSDIKKGLAISDKPQLEQLDLNNVAIVENGNIVTKINAVGPQVDTNIKQEPIVKYVNTTPINQNPVITQKPVQVATPAPTPTPTPAPVVKTVTKTVKPVSKPRTTRS